MKNLNAEQRAAAVELANKLSRWFSSEDPAPNSGDSDVRTAVASAAGKAPDHLAPGWDYRFAALILEAGYEPGTELDPRILVRALLEVHAEQLEHVEQSLDATFAALRNTRSSSTQGTLALMATGDASMAVSLAVADLRSFEDGDACGPLGLIGVGATSEPVGVALVQRDTVGVDLGGEA